jgi:hypothetical protein
VVVVGRRYTVVGEGDIVNLKSWSVVNKSLDVCPSCKWTLLWRLRHLLMSAKASLWPCKDLSIGANTSLSRIKASLWALKLTRLLLVRGKHVLSRSGHMHFLVSVKTYLWPSTVKARYKDFRYNDNRDIAIASGAPSLVTHVNNAFDIAIIVL